MPTRPHRLSLAGIKLVTQPEPLPTGLSRRDFLRGAAGAAAAALAARAWASPLPEWVPAIDTHIHFYDPTRPQGVPWPLPADPLYSPHLPDAFAALSAASGVVGVVAIEASTWPQDNQWLLDLAEKNPLIVGVIGLLEPGTPEFAAGLRRFETNPLLRGVRPHRLMENAGRPGYHDDLERLADLDLVLEAGGLPEVLPATARLAARHPHLRIVLQGLPLTDWDGADPAVLRRTLAEIAACPNIYAKASHIIRWKDGRLVEDPAVYRPGLDVLWDLFGTDRLIYGTDWPKPSLGTTYDRVHRIAADYFHGRGREAEEDFFWRNSLAVYRWRPRGRAAGLIYLSDRT